MPQTPKKIGKVTHYYTHLGVGIVKLEDSLKIGDKVKFQGHSTDFNQIVNQMQYDHQDIQQGNKGQEVGVKVNEKVKDGDAIFLVN